MLVYFVIIMILLCITIKEGFDEAVYKPPSELMNTMTNIMNGGITEDTVLNNSLTRQFNDIQVPFNSANETNRMKMGEIKECNDKILQIKDNITTINDIKMNYILYKLGMNDLNGLVQYIQRLDDIYTRLVNVNTELRNKANVYRSFNIATIDYVPLTSLNEIITRCNKAGFNIKPQTTQIK